MSDARPRTDRELLLLFGRELREQRQLLQKLSTQLDRGNHRFEQIGLKEQEQDSRITGLATEHSRLMATMDKQMATIDSLAETARAALRLTAAVQQQSEKAHRALFDEAGVIDRLEDIEDQGSTIAQAALKEARETRGLLETYRVQITTVVAVAVFVLGAVEFYMNYLR